MTTTTTKRAPGDSEAPQVAQPTRYPITDRLRASNAVAYRVTLAAPSGLAFREYVTSTPEALGAMVWRSLQAGWTVTAEPERNPQQ